MPAQTQTKALPAPGVALTYDDLLSLLKQSSCWLAGAAATDPIATNRQNARTLLNEIEEALSRARATADAGQVIAWQNPEGGAVPIIMAHIKLELRPEAASKYSIPLFAAARQVAP